MATGLNGRGNGRLRYVRFDTRVRGKAAPVHSGRTFVIVAAGGLLVLAGSLLGLFRDWRSRYRALAAYGAQVVAPAIDPLAEQTPPGIDPDDWRRAVADTHAVLVTVTASGLLDHAKMEALRTEIGERVARASPDTAIDELGRLWDDLEARAGPILTRKAAKPPYVRVRPGLLKRAPKDDDSSPARRPAAPSSRAAP